LSERGRTALEGLSPRGFCIADCTTPPVNADAHAYAQSEKQGRNRHDKPGTVKCTWSYNFASLLNQTSLTAGRAIDRRRRSVLADQRKNK